MSLICCQCGRNVQGSIWENGKPIEVPDFLCALCNCRKHGVSPFDVLANYVENEVRKRDGEPRLG